jgi:hypothetical protein
MTKALLRGSLVCPVCKCSLQRLALMRGVVLRIRDIENSFPLIMLGDQRYFSVALNVGACFLRIQGDILRNIKRSLYVLYVWLRGLEIGLGGSFMGDLKYIFAAAHIVKRHL